jgi:tetratricopeptide (TPR) repeat protein
MTIHIPRHGALPLTFALALLLGASAQAQNRRWADPYRDGVKAVDGKRYEEAVRLLERAVAVEPRDGANKQEDGVYRIDYFPYFYLGIAHTELKQFDKAQENFAKARRTLPPNNRQLQARFDEYQPKVQAGLAAPGGTPSGAGAGSLSGGTGTNGGRIGGAANNFGGNSFAGGGNALTTGGNASTGGRAPVEPAVNPAFETAVQRANAAIVASRFADALSAFDTARTADAAEYGRRGMVARRNDTARAYAQQLTVEGHQALPTSLTTARAKFQEADRTFNGLKEVADGISEIRRREDQYAQLKAGAEQDATAGNWKSAADKYAEARTAHPEQFATDNLTARVTYVNTRMAAASNPKLLAESDKLLAAGRLLASQGRYAEAEGRYSAALQQYPDNAAARSALDNSRRFADLVRAGRSLQDKNSDSARKQFETARALDRERFEREGLAALIAAPADTTGTVAPKDLVREAMVALVNGDAKTTITLLEAAAAQSTPPSLTASLRAYLGVAYATQAMTSPKPEEQTRLRGVALEHFRLALVSQRDYQLSPTLVSPKILALFEQARRN